MALYQSIYLSGYIDQEMAKSINKELIHIDNMKGRKDMVPFYGDKDQPITLIINSRGGEVSSALSIIDTMKGISTQINTMVLGSACSSAAIIALSGEKRYISKNSFLLFHNVSYYSAGTLEDHQGQYKEAEKQAEKIYNIIEKECGSKVKNHIKENSYKNDFTIEAKDTVDLGICHKVIVDNEITKLKLSETKISKKYNNFKKGEIHLLEVGNHHSGKYGNTRITKETLKEIVSNFDNNVVGQDISIDFTHDNDNGEDKAGAWIKELKIVKNKSLVATVEYTNSGKQSIQNGEYKYTSLELCLSYSNFDNNNFENVLTGATFTNRPVIKNLDIIKLSEPKQKELSMTTEPQSTEPQVVEPQVVEPQSTEPQVVEPQDTNTLLEELSNLKEEILKLKEEKSIEEKDKEINNLVKEGKILLNQKESIMSTFKNSTEIKNFYKNSLPIIKTDSICNSSQSEDPTINENLIGAFELSKEDIQKYSPKNIKGF